MNQPTVYDLTEIIRGAQRGRRRDIKHLCDHLEQGVFFIPLAEPLSTQAEGVRISETQVLRPHRLTHGDGSLYGALFTRAEILQPLEEREHWHTGGEALQFVRLPGRTALAVMLQLLEKEEIMGLFINPYHDTNLQLNPQEVDHIFHGEPIPLLNYVQNLPPGPDEKIRLGDVQETLPTTLVEAIAGFLGCHPELASYDLVESYNEERDIKPCLAVNLHTHPSESTDHQGLAMELIKQVQDLIPPPGGLRVFFNEQVSRT